jgi:hypothetical protein
VQLAVIATVALSILAHGLSARPAVRAMASRWEPDPEPASGTE